MLGEVCAERYGSVLEVPPSPIPILFATAHEFVLGGDDRISLPIEMEKREAD